MKALLQRKPLPEKQAAAAPRADAEADKATKLDPAPARALPQPAQAETRHVQAAPATPAPVQAAAAISTNEAPQPALSPAPTQAVPAAADTTAPVDGPRPSDLAAERKLDLSRDSAWLDRLAHDIARAGSDDAPLRFRLHPQTLGSLQVELQQGDHGTAVRLTVDTETARRS